jgi:hypothetical protein
MYLEQQCFNSHASTRNRCISVAMFKVHTVIVAEGLNIFGCYSL